nr:MAG TPA: hypothetical protein [Caudoviricetes sp.]
MSHRRYGYLLNAKAVWNQAAFLFPPRRSRFLFSRRGDS